MAARDTGHERLFRVDAGLISEVCDGCRGPDVDAGVEIPGVVAVVGLVLEVGVSAASGSSLCARTSFSFLW